MRIIIRIITIAMLILHCKLCTKKITPPIITVGSINNQSSQDLSIRYKDKTFSFDNYRFDNNWAPKFAVGEPIFFRLGNHNTVTITLLPDQKTLEFLYDAPGAQGTVREEVTTPRATVEFVTTTANDPIQTFVTLWRQ
ncbi:hypothetical protein M1466_00465 [Candidatus Dependentiae bacterium]|nr:hypothetical protein [Candidatus Dependentiae bacterium]